MLETSLAFGLEALAHALSRVGVAPPAPRWPVAEPLRSGAFLDGVEPSERLAAERIVQPRPQLRRDAKTVVLFALDQEARPFLRRAEGRKDLEVRTSGMGPRNAEAAISRILDEGRPRHVITAGLAGALRPDLEVGDIVFETADASLAKRLIALGAKRLQFATSERVAVTAAEKRRMREQTGADVVENESGAVQAFCRARGIACTTIRVVSDTADEDLPFDFNELKGPDGNVDTRKVAAALARAPWKLPAVLRLRHNTDLATQKLSSFLEQAIPQR